MAKLRVGVLRGGPSSEYEVSLRTGAHILEGLNREQYVATDILLSKKGEWVMNGILTDPGEIAHHVDVVWNALHGEFGEDGKVQRILDLHQIPYTGSPSLPSAIAMHKHLAKERFVEAKLRVPAGAYIAQDENKDEAVFSIFHNFAMPVIIKPALGGSSLGITVAKNHDELLSGVAELYDKGPVVVEEFIRGREATCAVIEGSDGTCYALEPIEIVMPKHKHFFDYGAKYNDEAEEICPGDFTAKEKAEIQRAAIVAHQALGLRQYSRSDFLLTDRGLYILETNSLPGLTKQSLLPKALKQADIEFGDFLDHVIQLAVR